jgi:glycosyltransferase involved in cell wall biosynthesis
MARPLAFDSFATDFGRHYPRASHDCGRHAGFFKYADWSQPLAMQDEPLVSVIIPVFKAGKKLEATLASIFYDGARSMEVIVVDGGPPEETIEALRQYQYRIRLVSEPDKGIYDAMNKGIAVSTGRFLYFIGAGDLLFAKGMEAMWPHLSECAPHSPVLFYSNVLWRPGPIYYDGKFSKAKIARKNICHQAIIYSREVFARHGLYDLQYRVLADHAFNIKCFADSEIAKVYVDTVLADYEGAGASAGQDDVVFKKHRWRLAASLGPTAFVVHVFQRAGSAIWRRLTKLIPS